MATLWQPLKLCNACHTFILLPLPPTTATTLLDRKECELFSYTISAKF